jgi:hypothetical protein
MILTEGVFRKPRLRTNEILRKFAHLFDGSVVNVSASNDSDKNCSLFEYYCGDYDSGSRYKSYFSRASSYYITNYPNDETPLQIRDNEIIYLDLESDLDDELKHRFDVVFNHTVLEHVFDVFSAFRNLCLMSRDIVIVVVPQCQQIHDFERGYTDYWRFTPFSVDKLFTTNGFAVLYRETTYGFSESQYLFYIASRNPEKWAGDFPSLLDLDQYITRRNNGSFNTTYSLVIRIIDSYIRQAISFLRRNLTS